MQILDAVVCTTAVAKGMKYEGRVFLGNLKSRSDQKHNGTEGLHSRSSKTSDSPTITLVCDSPHLGPASRLCKR